jgi:eukaryotic-like serine/threonine-protein kinase
MELQGQRWDRADRIFSAALALAPGARGDLLARECADDPELRSLVERLLADANEADPVIVPGGVMTGPLWKGLAAELADPVEPGGHDESLEGREVGPYRLLRRLGRGGMGSVYLAERADVQKQVALKLLRPAFGSRELSRRFQLEQRVLARLDHPNIARLLDAGVLPGAMPYFVMEYVDGEPLTEHGRRADLRTRLRLFEAVCAAAACAHQHLVVHRDLKPSNILVNRDGIVKLIDFGISKALEGSDDDSGEDLTQEGSRLMTPGYAAPEQVRGEPITPAADVYALGLLLYELLTGQRPYNLRGLTPSEVEKVVCEGTTPRPSLAVAADATTLHLARRLAGDLDAICLKALEKDPERRYPTATELKADIDRYLSNRPVEARPPTTRYFLRKFIGRHRWAVMAGTLAAFALLAGSLAVLWQARLAIHERERAEAALSESRAVGDFLIDLFEARDPGTGNPPSVDDLIERGRQRADQLTAQPLVQARMLDTIGRVYHHLGRHEQAEPLLRRALALRSEKLGSEDAQVAATRDHLARLLHGRGAYDEAEREYREALALRRRLLGNEHPDTAQTLAQYGLFRLLRDDLDGAAALIGEALAVQRRALGNAHPDVASTLHRLASVHAARKDYAGSERLEREALEIHRATLGPSHEETLVSLGNLAGSLAQQGHDLAAEQAFREVLEHNRRVLGARHPRVANTLNNLGTVLERQGQAAEAERMYVEAIAINEDVLGKEHPKVAWVSANLGRLLTGVGRFPEAEALYERALRIYLQRFEPDHSTVVELHRRMAALYRAWQKPERADHFERLVPKTNP